MEQYTNLVERGNKIIYPENKENWASCVRNRLQDVYNGADLETALQIMEALENKTEMYEIEELLNRTTFSNNAHFLILKIILSFSKYGPEFMEYISHGDVSDDLKLAIENQRKENENLENIHKDDEIEDNIFRDAPIDRAITEAELLRNKDEKTNLDSLVNPNKALQIRKSNIFSKIVDFIKGLFKKQKYKAINQINPIYNNSENSENNKLINLQDKFENNQVKLSDLSDNEVKDLNSLYQSQINVLKNTLNYKKVELNINKAINI